MCIFRRVLAVCFLAALGSVAVFAQGGAARPAATPARTTPPPARPAGPAVLVPTPSSKVAFINTQAFTDDKAGITRLVAAIQQVTREFKPQQDQIQALQADINKKVTDLESLQRSGLGDATKVATQSEEIERLKKEYQRKGEDGTAAFNKRLNDITRPYQEEIGRAIDDFAAKRGITMVFDAAIFNQGGVLFLAPGVDITQEFIAEFNARPPGAR